MSVAKFDLLYWQLIADDGTKSPSALYQTTAATSTASEPGPEITAVYFRNFEGLYQLPYPIQIWYGTCPVGEHHHFSPEARIRYIPRADSRGIPRVLGPLSIVPMGSDIVY